MDINDFIENFLTSHQNSRTNSLLQRFKLVKNTSSLSSKCSFINQQVVWIREKEGYYYYYFLQVRLAYGIALFLYETGDFINSRECLQKAKMFIRYASTYNPYLGDRHKQNLRAFERKRTRYVKACDNLSRLLEEKNY